MYACVRVRVRACVCVRVCVCLCAAVCHVHFCVTAPVLNNVEGYVSRLFVRHCTLFDALQSDGFSGEQVDAQQARYLE